MLARCVAEVQDEKPYLVIKNETAINCCLRQKKKQNQNFVKIGPKIESNQIKYERSPNDRYCAPVWSNKFEIRW